MTAVITTATGFVSIVGAGPGDPDLMTRKALRCLKAADIVFYDALVSPEALDECAPHAQRFSVGKRAGRHSVSQARIHQLLIRAARRGKRVVRLKGGDPLVFGRGGEEAIALRLAGVPFEIVPGISAATAAPAMAGIPVTHRGAASAFVVLAGHAEASFRPVLMSLAPNTATLVVLMGVATRAALAATLLERGWRPSTPVAIVAGASTPAQTEWFGTLRELGQSPDPGADAASIVIGEVVNVAAFIGRPVSGRLRAPAKVAVGELGEVPQRALASGQQH